MDLKKNSEKNNHTDGIPIHKGNEEMTEVWETPMSILQIVTQKHIARPLSV